MAAQQFQWMGSQAPRAKVIPASTWEQHKAELEDLYQKMKLEDVMSAMKSSYGFEPTRRQYVFRFRKWEFQKHNRNMAVNEHDDDDPRQHASNSLSCPTPSLSSPSTDNMGQPRMMLSGVKRKTGPMMPPKKRTKPSLQPHVTSMGDAASTEDTISMPDRRDPANPSRARSSGGRLYRSASDFEATSDGETTTLVDDELAEGKTTSVAESSNLDFRSDELKQPLAAQQHHADGLPPVSEPVQATNPVLQLDIPEPFEAVCDLGHDRMEDVVVAADFLAISQCPADAFVLCLLLLKRHLVRSDLPGWMIESATIGCVRPAVSFPHLQIIRNLFEYRLKSAPAGDQFAVRRFIYHTFLWDIYMRLGDKSAAVIEYTHAKVCIQGLVAQHHTLSAMHEAERALFLGACRVLRRSTIVSVFDTSVSSLRDQLDDLMVRQSHYNIVETFDKTVRSCLKWCELKLKQRPRLPIVTSINAGACKDVDFAAFLSLYHWLFYAWLGDRGSTVVCCCWQASIKSKTTLSPSKFLGMIALMLSDYGPLKRPLTQPGIEKSHKQLDTILAAALGICETLSTFRALELASIFTDAYNTISDGALGRSELEESTYETGLRLSAKGHVENGLNLKLSILPPLESLKSNDLESSPQEQQPSSRPKSDAIPTLAPSLRSSSYLSLISLKDRLQASIEKHFRGYEATLPSKFLKHGSRSTLSFLLAYDRRSLSQRSGSLRAPSHVGSETIEALAAFSARARHRGSRVKHGSQTEVIDIDTMSTRYSNLSVED